MFSNGMVNVILYSILLMLKTKSFIELPCFYCKENLLHKTITIRMREGSILIACIIQSSQTLILCILSIPIPPPPPSENSRMQRNCENKLSVHESEMSFNTE